MYLPDHFRVADLPEMHALMRARPLATFVSAGSMGLYATHLPTVLRDDGPYGVIECHLARANPHWKDLAALDLFYRRGFRLLRRRERFYERGQDACVLIKELR